MRVLKKDGKVYKERLKRLLSNKWLDRKHIKHSRIVVAHRDSWTANSENDYHCLICGRAGACYTVQNKRRNISGGKSWDTNIRFCRDCDTEVYKSFPVKYYYCG